MPTTVRTVKVPLQHTGRYVTRRVDAHLNHSQGQTLRDLLDALVFSGARLASGREVRTAAHAMQWLLEHVGKGAESKQTAK